MFVKCFQSGVSPPGRCKILVELHQGRPGVSRMKSLSRMYTWWPRMDDDIELIIKRCSKFQENQNKVHHGADCILIMLDHF